MQLREEEKWQLSIRSKHPGGAMNGCFDHEQAPA
jgi:hypothetical protein